MSSIWYCQLYQPLSSGDHVNYCFPNSPCVRCVLHEMLKKFGWSCKKRLSRVAAVRSQQPTLFRVKSAHNRLHTIGRSTVKYNTVPGTAAMLLLAQTWCGGSSPPRAGPAPRRAGRAPPPRGPRPRAGRTSLASQRCARSSPRGCRPAREHTLTVLSG